MSFIPTQSGIRGAGNPTAKIMVIGDVPDPYSLKIRKPFSGRDATVFEQSAHQAGLIKADLYLTYLVKDRASPDAVWNKKSKKFVIDTTPHVDILRQEIASVQPNVIITLGDAPCAIFTGRKSAAKFRGYVYESPKSGLKILPTLNPRDMIYSNYIHRYYLTHDLLKAKKNSGTPKVEYPKIKIETPTNFIDACRWLRYFKKQKKVSCDIEVINYCVSCIAYASDSRLAISIPYHHAWTLAEETELWRLTADVLEDPDIIKVWQNGIFDIHFLATRQGILPKGQIEDTMIAHSIVYPDFLKSLGFLASIYTDLPYWKDLVNFKNIKSEA